MSKRPGLSESEVEAVWQQRNPDFARSILPTFRRLPQRLGIRDPVIPLRRRGADVAVEQVAPDRRRVALCRRPKTARAGRHHVDHGTGR